ncbi:RNA ligase family protein [Chitinophaga arvensicola]|uniref:RNA ligase, Rnl2 family n=1 Tax=Chitinophaga arvensicola TaxID=29529 RepID=A0A1I0SDJ6_9BACT|nr:RNA ligase family protein [Chitinophaga arvensicola]SEW56389.1 RNA ligase, Rnl2 family [Chitinophaga arvensicola]
MNKNTEYEKMPKNLKGLHLSDKEQHALNKLKWVVTEKIHGANFSFVYENHQLLYAKRKDYLRWTDDFFGFQAVAAEMETQLIRLFEQLKQDIPAHKYIIYGELFGGKYPHPEVVAAPEVQAIQTGVYYSPSIRFCAFDIAIETTEKAYLDYETAVRYFEQFNILYAKILFSGKWNEALNFNTRIDSQIPAQLNLPMLTPNLIEGIVIKPLHHSGVSDLSRRPIIKLKNPEFDEEEKFHEAEKWSFIPNVTTLSEELSFLVDEMTHYITENRLNSALSKIGRLDPGDEKRMQEIKKELQEDVLTDFNEDNDKILDELDEEKREWVKERVWVRVSEFVSGAGNALHDVIL